MNKSSFTKWLFLIGLLLLGGIGIWFAWEPLSRLLSDPSGETLQQWVASLGMWGPVALIILGVVQVLVAPLPGYPIIFVSGVLYGGFWGAIYANIGILLAGMSAASLARVYGRPLVERFIEGTHLQRFERLLDNHSLWFWFILLTVPTGDYPYFIAGLSRVPMKTFFIALCAARLPFTFVITYTAAEAMTLSSETLLLLVPPILLVGTLAYWQQERIGRWIHNWFERLLPTEDEGKIIPEEVQR